MDDEQVAALTGQLIDHVAEIVVLIDQLGIIRFVNKRAAEILHMPSEDWIGRSAFDILHPDDLALGMELLVSARASGRGVKEPVTYRLRTGDGTWLAVEVIASTIALSGGELAMVLSGRDVSSRRPGSEIVSEASERLSRMFEDAPICMAQTGLDGRFLRVNRSFAEMLGRPAAQMVGQPFAGFLHPDDALDGRAAFQQLVAGTLPTYRRSVRYLGADGRVIHAELTATLVRDRHGAGLYCAAQAVDITPLREAQAELLHLSTHDPLTGLANRVLLMTLLSKALSRAARRDDAIAVLFLDLDGFKSVNDTYGHAVGDDLLVEVAHRLSAIVRHGDVASRLGGDEFVVMCEDAEPSGVNEIARRLIAALAEPFSIGHVNVRIGVTVGMAIEAAATVGAEELIRHADTALYQAKRGARGQITQYQIPTATESGT